MNQRWRGVVVFLVVVGVLILGSITASAAQEFRYDFDSVPDGALPEGFHVFAGDWKVENGRLVGQAGSYAMGQIVFGDPSWTDVEVEATLTYLSVEAPTRWAAIIYRAPAKGGYPYQLFTVRQGAAATNGTELAWRTPQDAWNVRLTKPYSSNMELGKEYRFKIVIQGTSAKYYINDELIIESPDLVSEKQGTVGFMVDGARVAFDDVVVRIP